MPDASMTVDNVMRSADPYMSAAAGDHPRQRSLTCQVDCVADGAWDDLISAFDDTHHEQTARFAIRQWNSRESHILLSEAGVPVAGARLAVITLPGCKTGLAFLRFGPFWRRRDRAPDLGLYRSAIAALVDEYCVRRGHCLTIIPRPNPDFYQTECDALAELGFSIRRKNPDPNRYLVDLSLDQDAQLKSLDQKWRYNLRQALANGFDIRMCESDADFQAFQSLYDGMVARKNFSSTPPDHLIDGRNDRVAPALQPRLALAFHQGRPMVGATVGIFGDTAYYTFGASAAAALSLKGGYALQWWIVCWLSREHRTRWYDLGGEAGERGLRQFKKGFVGKRGAIVVMHGEYDRWTYLPGRVATDLIFGLRGAQRVIREWRYGG